jgi:hypothetical protein
MMGTIRGGGDPQEIRALQLEIAGLDTMALNLSSSLSLLQNRLAYSRRSATPLGRVCLVPASYGFSVYCVYRVLTTSLAALWRLLAPDAALVSSDSDPVTRALSLVASTVHPKLDRQAWSRQISFALSGAILLASLSSVLQTVHMLGKVSPSLVRQARANLALLVAQVSAAYVISSALLLRGNLPAEMRSAVSAALGSPGGSWRRAWRRRWASGRAGAAGTGRTRKGTWRCRSGRRTGSW